MSCAYESDAQSDVDSPPTFYSSSQGRFGDILNRFGSMNGYSGYNRTGMDLSTTRGSGGDYSSPTRGTLLKIQRFEQVYDLDTNKTVVRNVDEAQAQDEKKADTSVDNVFNVWRTVTPNPYNPAAPPRVSVTIDIQSEYLRTTCKKVIGGYMGMSWNVEPLKVDPKIFIAYLHKLRTFAEAMDHKEEDKTADETVSLSHLKFLISFIEDEYAEQVSEIGSYIANGEISFDLLWAIMHYRMPVFTNCTVTGQPRLGWINGMDVVKIDGRTACVLDAECIDYNARSHRSDSKQREDEPMFGITKLYIPPIWEFKGAMKIRDLAAFPMAFHADLSDLLEKLCERGKRWTDLQGMHHMHYSGNAFYRTPKGCIAKHYVDSRIMIDWKALEEIEPNFTLPYTSKGIGSDDGYRMLQYNLPSEKYRESVDFPLEFTSPILYGFSFSDKLWLMFDVDNVRTFEWSDEPINNLVLPPTTKSLVKALVERHAASNRAFDDFVNGKGQGLVINLFGNPGVGKTLTAEATSEHVKKPLYVVGAGDLGTSARELDQQLTRIFKAATKWGAVVLIDEADVFLEERSLHDLDRNAVVSVFLRQLEYYRGILFLTTNRVRTFDEAFQSRIHLSLHYNDLDSDAKRQIWIAFIKKSHSNAELTDGEFDELAEKKVNGRQIKNVVGTAAALAENNGEKLGYKHLVGVLELMDQFKMDYSGSRS